MRPDSGKSFCRQDYQDRGDLDFVVLTSLKVTLWSILRFSMWTVMSRNSWSGSTGDLMPSVSCNRNIHCVQECDQIVVSTVECISAAASVGGIMVFMGGIPSWAVAMEILQQTKHVCTRACSHWIFRSQLWGVTVCYNNVCVWKKMFESEFMCISLIPRPHPLWR